MRRFSSAEFFCRQRLPDRRNCRRASGLLPEPGKDYPPFGGVFRMRTLTSLVLVAALAVPVFAQQRQRGGGGFGGGMFGGGTALLNNEDVQKDLKITDEQKTKIKEFNDKQTA